MNILIFGRGRMALAMKKVCDKEKIKNCLYLDNPDFMRIFYDIIGFEDTVCVYLGKGSQIQKAVEICQQSDTPLIQGSTDLKHSLDYYLGKNSKIVAVNAPNLSIPIIRSMKHIPTLINGIREGLEVHILESHQAGKETTSGTAKSIAKKIDLAESNIVSVRDIPTQLANGVPLEHLEGHGYHDFILTGQGVQIKISTKINGRDTYAYGAIKVAAMLIKHKEELRGKIHFLPDIINLLD